MLKPSDGKPPLPRDRGVLIGCWFIQRSPQGRPIAAGRIVKGIRAGEYVLAYTTREPDVAVLRTATTEQMIDNNFELWAHEGNWHRAYTGELSPRGHNEQELFS
jgi:hypothetical protein